MAHRTLFVGCLVPGSLGSLAGLGFGFINPHDRPRPQRGRCCLQSPQPPHGLGLRPSPRLSQASGPPVYRCCQDEKVARKWIRYAENLDINDMVSNSYLARAALEQPPCSKRNGLHVHCLHDPEGRCTVIEGGAVLVWVYLGAYGS